MCLAQRHWQDEPGRPHLADATVRGAPYILRLRERDGAAMCKVKNCNRAEYSSGLCGFHAIQGHYRTEIVPGAGLAAVRVPGPPRILRHLQRQRAAQARARA